ncbi:IclR family transcriptional regulator [Actinoalloteichus spitiensis]|uniref:IclR family transcriptional regulator n=1 Tax=Actinoalloteichus spitiensis TaxID=252394 RepID=UPI0003644A3C|nr:IclR family transcriptional regulator [Actinoalloteichus spitiensis]
MGDSSDVPALRRGLALLRALGSRPSPVSAAHLAREVGLPRSSTYHLLGELVAAGFVVHYPEEHRYGLGWAAADLGSAHSASRSLERLGRPLLTRLAATTGHPAQLVVPHGAEVVYLVKAQPPTPQTLVTRAEVRLPATLPASGRAILGGLPPAQVRALFPRTASFVRRTGRGPRSLPELRALLARQLRRGWAVEDGCVTESWASVAAPVFDHGGRAVAAVSLTFRHVCEGADECGREWPDLAVPVTRTAEELTARIGGGGRRRARPGP